jgi:NAD(P)-dependent dehydrogenase (short-subunit alcohol dehydrogenase family)
MRILIASGDSVIGSALAHHYQQAGYTVVCTTRKCDPQEANYLDVRERRWQHTGPKFDRVVYTIAHDAPTGPLDVFSVNTVGAYNWLGLVAATACAPGAQVAVLTSQFGSIEEVSNTQVPWYRMSKAALNMGVKLLAHKHTDLRWLCVHPGLVDTPMTKGLSYTHEKLHPQDSARMIADLLDRPLPFGFYDAPTGRRIAW